jgi:hypothetical protein
LGCGLGWALGYSAGYCWAVWPGKPASSFSFISDFLFSVFYIVNLSAVLNSNILQTLLVEFK